MLIDVHHLCCHQRPYGYPWSMLPLGSWQCLWSMLPLEVMWMPMVCAAVKCHVHWYFMLPSEAMLMSVVHAASRGHVDNHDPYCHLGPPWCLWSMWIPEAVLRSMLCAALGSCVDAHDVCWHGGGNACWCSLLFCYWLLGQENFFCCRVDNYREWETLKSSVTLFPHPPSQKK